MIPADDGAEGPDLAILIRQLRYRCRSRGTRELAGLLSNFLASEGPALSGAELQVFARLLDTCDDPELMDFLLGARPWPDWTKPVAIRIDAHLQFRRSDS